MSSAPEQWRPINPDYAMFEALVSALGMVQFGRSTSGDHIASMKREGGGAVGGYGATPSEALVQMIKQLADSWRS